MVKPRIRPPRNKRTWRKQPARVERRKSPHSISGKLRKHASSISREMPSKQIKIVFVCAGGRQASPAAVGILNKLAKKIRLDKNINASSDNQFLSNHRPDALDGAYIISSWGTREDVTTKLAALKKQGVEVTMLLDAPMGRMPTDSTGFYNRAYVASLLLKILENEASMARAAKFK